MSTTALPPVLEAVEFDDEGFMVDPNAWTPEIAEGIAQAIGLELTDRHWVVKSLKRVVNRQHYAASQKRPMSAQKKSINCFLADRRRTRHAWLVWVNLLDAYKKNKARLEKLNV